MTLPPLAINGKFLAASPTGVHRVAAEIARALARRMRARPGELDIELWIPHDAADAAEAIGLPVRTVRPFVHIAWEQLALPLHDRSRLLLNLCNIGPILRANAVTMIHDAQVYLTPQSYRPAFRYWYKSLLPILGRRNARILTVSDYSREQIVRFGICRADKIDVIHNGVDHFRDVASDRRIIDRLALAGRPFVLALADPARHKNIATLAKSFADPRLADIALVLAGGANAARMAEGGVILPRQAILTGRVSDGELKALYENALCLAFPSRTEGFGLPPVEAMLHGCPALVAPCGALPEICGTASLYAGPDDIESWTAQILRLHGDASWRALWSARGRQRAADFSWDRAAERLLAALRRHPAVITGPGRTAQTQTERA